MAHALMRSKLLTLAVIGSSLVLAACGSSSSSSSSSAGGASAKRHRGAPSHIYHLRLSGNAETPPGPAIGAGSAVIALHLSSRQVCWRFTHLHGFTNATFAHLHRGVKGTSGPIVVPLSTAPKLHHKGCVHANPTVMTAIAKDPHGYYLNIHSKQYPGGAVRSQL